MVVSNGFYFGAGALLFTLAAAFGIATGRFKTQVFKRDPYLRRKEDPALFWTYACALLIGALFLVYIAIASSG